MKASQMIKELSDMIEKYGDLEVSTLSADYDDYPVERIEYYFWPGNDKYPKLEYISIG